MTQIKKTLGIAGIIALVTAPAMADIASTQYVQNALSGITNALDAKLSNTSTDAYGIAIGSGATVLGEDDANTHPMAIGDGAYAEYNSLAIGYQASTPQDGMGEGVAIGYKSKADSDETVAIGNNSHAEGWGGTAIGMGAQAGENSVSIGMDADTHLTTYAATAIGGDSTKVDERSDYGIAIGGNAQVGKNAPFAIQLGYGENATPNTFNVGLGDEDVDSGDLLPYPLLVSGGTIPYERFAPEIPDTCKAANNQTCALVIKWNSTQNKFTQSWEVVKVSE